ncbi:sodium/glutamate symporter [Lelliottia amnigena]|uniref:Sodium/glutamate symporter n=1 Tax=Lelliottia amnigena TaxID=61646 RepID=A0AAP2AFP8_LELAM|nr:sodium/glutamate symporter [Lelliottia amnigena]MBL5900058.1 sodium/glutamate symporter [Lelliottia amnigena]MBL5935572.1 sodium/glutamate symporter [Lelliottia amnigena]
MVTLIEIPLLVSMTIAILSLYLGIRINQALNAFHTWGIPNVVTGGLVVASVCGLLYTLTNIHLSFDLCARDILLLYFFTSIGLNIRLADVSRGGKSLCILFCLTSGLMVLQNLVSSSVVSAFSLPPSLSILLGSLALTGGHGTAIAWAPMIDAHYGIENAHEIGIAVATLGLIAGSLIGGPLAHRLISRFRLKATGASLPVVGLPEALGSDGANDINHFVLLRTIAFIHIAILSGYGMDAVLQYMGIKMPLFVSALVMAMVIANGVPRLFPRIAMPARTRALALISDLSLELFLALSLIGMQLWQLADVGLAVLVLFLLHVVIAVLYILLIVFPLMGRDYDSAVIASGFAGIALGSTATAFTNMSTTTAMHGSSPKAFILLSLVAALFLDIANSSLVALLMR